LGQACSACCIVNFDGTKPDFGERGDDISAINTMTSMQMLVIGPFLQPEKLIQSHVAHTSASQSAGFWAAPQPSSGVEAWTLAF